MAYDLGRRPSQQVRFDQLQDQRYVDAASDDKRDARSRSGNCGSSVFSNCCVSYPQSEMDRPIDRADFGYAERFANQASLVISLRIPVEVSGKDVARSTFTIATTAINLNRHIATIH